MEKTKARFVKKEKIVFSTDQDLSQKNKREVIHSLEIIIRLGM